MDIHNKKERSHIEEEIEMLYDYYFSQDFYWETQIYKCPNRKNIKIKYPKYYHKKNAYLFTYESLCHYLSIFELPDISFLEIIVLIPKFIAIENYFLNNLYIAKKQLLTFYLTPIRLYLSRLPEIEIKKHSMLQSYLSMDRILWEEPYSTKFQNLFYTLSLINERREPINQQIYKFIDFTEKLTHQEILEMNKIHDFFLLKHPINQI